MTRMANERASMMGMGTGMMAMDAMGMMRSMSGTAGSPAMGGMGMAGSGMMMVPRCRMEMQKTADGMRMMCMTDDAMARSMMQNLCSMMAGGAISCCMMMNGMSLMTCNMAMGMCRCEMTDEGMMMSCASGDPRCAQMIMACCDGMAAMMKSGCMCCLMMNGMPVCCSM